MRISDILDVARTTMTLPAAGKDVTLSALADLFSDLPASEVYRVFLERESLASTGIGSGVAVPHGRLADATKMVGALAISREGVDFDSVDGRPVHIFVALVAPERKTGEHLKALARISRLLRDDGLRQQLVAAESGEAALQLLVRADGG